MQTVVPNQVRHAAVAEGRAKVAALAGFALLPYLVLQSLCTRLLDGRQEGRCDGATQKA